MKYVLVLLRSAIIALAISSLALAEERGYIKRTLVNIYGVETNQIQEISGSNKLNFKLGYADDGSSLAIAAMDFRKNINHEPYSDPFDFSASLSSRTFAPLTTYTSNFNDDNERLYFTTNLGIHVSDIVGYQIADSAVRAVKTGHIRRVIIDPYTVHYLEAHFTVSIYSRYNNQFLGLVVFDIRYQSNLCNQEEYNTEQVATQLKAMTQNYNQCASTLSTRTSQLNQANRNYSQCVSSLATKDRTIADLKQLTGGSNNQCSSLLENKNQEILALKQALNSTISKNPEIDILKSQVTKLKNRVRSLRLKLRNNR